jgi:cytochrome c biogenesis protein CcmG, thiol:disulfide interchange protein DsbE
VGAVRHHLRTGLAILAVIGALIATVVLSGPSSESGTGRPAPQLPTSVLVPPKPTLASLHGKPAAINFWASWCTPCRQEAPQLERLARTLDGRAGLVGVDWNDTTANATDFIHEHGLTYPILSDTDGVVGMRYGIHGLPTTFILNSRGTITDVLPGPQSVGSLRHALDAAG